MKRKPGSFLSVLLVISVGVLALLSPSCGGGEPEEDYCSVGADLVLETDDGSYVTLHANTDIIPCSEMEASYVPLADLPDEECLPCNPEKAAEGGCLYSQATAITAIDVTPNDVRFRPPGELDYALPETWPGNEGDWLWIYQNNPASNCPNAWTIVSVGAATVTEDLDRAIGEINHTCIFLLVDLRGDFNAMGRLTQPVELQSDSTLVMSLDVVASSTNPELAGELVTFFLYGTQYEYGGDKLLSLLMEYFQPGTTLLIHHETTGNTVIWSDSQVVQFDCEKVSW